MNLIFENVKLHLSKLTPSERKIAEWLGRSGHQVAFRTLNELAEDIGVSEATIIRFARKVGYANYPGFQREVQMAIEEQFSLGAKFTRSMSEKKHDDLVGQVYRTQMANLRETFEALDPLELQRCVALIAEARRVAVVGFRASSGVATYLSFALNLVRPDVAQIQLSLDNVHDQLLDYTPDDVLIAFSLTRPARKTLEVVEETKKKGLTIIAITNSRFSAVSSLADHVLIGATHGTFNSYSAITALCHLLLESTGRVLQKSAEERLRELDALNNKDVFLLT